MKNTQCLIKNIKLNYQKLTLLIIACVLLITMINANRVYASELKPTDLERIQIGTPPPDFNLESVDGNWMKLTNYKNKKNVILVFYRGYW